MLNIGLQLHHVWLHLYKISFGQNLFQTLVIKF
jgi:hypothetical protein